MKLLISAFIVCVAVVRCWSREDNELPSAYRPDDNMVDSHVTKRETCSLRAILACVNMEALAARSDRSRIMADTGGFLSRICREMGVDVASIRRCLRDMASVCRRERRVLYADVAERMVPRVNFCATTEECSARQQVHQEIRACYPDSQLHGDDFCKKEQATVNCMARSMRSCPDSYAAFRPYLESLAVGSSNRCVTRVPQNTNDIPGGCSIEAVLTCAGLKELAGRDDLSRIMADEGAFLSRMCRQMSIDVGATRRCLSHMASTCRREGQSIIAGVADRMIPGVNSCEKLEECSGRERVHQALSECFSESQQYKDDSCKIQQMVINCMARSMKPCPDSYAAYRPSMEMMVTKSSHQCTLEIPRDTDDVPSGADVLKTTSFSIFLLLTASLWLAHV